MMINSFHGNIYGTSIVEKITYRLKYCPSFEIVKICWAGLCTGSSCFVMETIFEHPNINYLKKREESYPCPRDGSSNFLGLRLKLQTVQLLNHFVGTWSWYKLGEMYQPECHLVVFTCNILHFVPPSGRRKDYLQPPEKLPGNQDYSRQTCQPN